MTVNKCQRCHREIWRASDNGEWIDCWSEPSCPTGENHAGDVSEIETEPMDVWQLLEDAPSGCDAVASLYQWSTNYDCGKGPFTLFIDLIGWSEDNIGSTIYPYSDLQGSLGYVELDKLADALTAYADRPHDVSDYVSALLEAEAR